LRNTHAHTPTTRIRLKTYHLGYAVAARIVTIKYEHYLKVETLKHTLPWAVNEAIPAHRRRLLTTN